MIPHLNLNGFQSPASGSHQSSLDHTSSAVSVLDFFDMQMRSFARQNGMKVLKIEKGITDLIPPQIRALKRLIS